MIEQINNALNFYAFFVSNRVGATSQTITVDVYDGTTDLVVTGGNATELGGGFYKYALASTDNAAEGELFALFKSTDSTLDQQEIPVIWTIGKAGVENLNATISSRAVSTDIVSDGNAFAGANINATISSRSTLTTTDILSDGNAFAGANINATISSRSTLTTTDILSDGTAFPGANIDAALSSVATLGAGSITYTLTVTVGGSGLDGVDVWVTSDLAGSTVIARGDTNDSGQVTFQLDAGTYYAWKQLAGYTFTNPETITVST